MSTVSAKEDVVVVGVSALLFVVSAALTTFWCVSMSAMGGMPMPGGWTMSIAWMRMPGQTWPGAAASFMGMWIVMMVAMMLPSLVPMLRRYRRADAPRRRESTRSGLRTALVGAGYFFVWSAFGAAAFPIGRRVGSDRDAAPGPRACRPDRGRRGHADCRRVPVHDVEGPSPCQLASGAGPEGPPSPGVGAAWRHGVRLGLDCACCCANLMAILLFAGLMDLRAMAVVTAAITIERLAPGGVRAARVIGAVVVGAAILTLATSTGR